MSDERVSVAEAAEVLGVHPQRIHQRIREGSLPAVKVGNQWSINRVDLRRLAHHSRPGRPLSSKSAWDLLAVADSDQAASQLSPSARSRARSRLASLLADAGSGDLEDSAAQIVNALRNRAERALFIASPRDLPDLREDRRVHLSGVSLRESNMSAGDLAEGYVSAGDLDGLVDDYLLSSAPRSRANVILHVVPDEAGRLDELALDDVARSPLALASDLAEHDGIREKSEALRSLANLHAQLLAAEAPANGSNRD